MKKTKLTAARIVMTILTVAAVGFIFGNSLMNADDSSAESGRILGFINGILRSMNAGFEASEFIVRKAAHFTEFAVLGVLLSVTFRLYVQKPLKAALFAVSAGLCTAVCDELIQMSSSGRSCEIRDMLIDFSGVVFAALIVFLILRLKDRRKKNERSSAE